MLSRLLRRLIAESADVRETVLTVERLTVDFRLSVL